MSWKVKSKFTGQDLLTDLRKERSFFEDAVNKAQLSKDAFTDDEKKKQEEVIKKVKEGLDEIENMARGYIESGDTIGREEYDALFDKIQFLTRLRAYVLPEIELEGEAAQVINDLAQWRIPAEAVSQVRKYQDEGMKKVAQGKFGNIEKARASLNKIYDDYDYWNGHVYDYGERLELWNLWLVASTLIFLGLSIFLFFPPQFIEKIPLLGPYLGIMPLTFIGFLFAAALGSTVSVLMKPPTISVYGDTILDTIRPYQRVLTGVAAGILGYGILATGILAIPVSKDTNIPQIIRDCGCGVLACNNSESKTVDANDGGTGGKPRVIENARGQHRCNRGHAAGNLRPPASGPLRADSKTGNGVNGKSDSTGHDGKGGCTAVSRIILLALGVGMGFGERLLLTFEDMIFGKASRKANGQKENKPAS